MPDTFRLLFLCILALTCGVRLWLKLRQWRHIAAHRTADKVDDNAQCTGIHNAPLG